MVKEAAEKKPIPSANSSIYCKITKFIPKIYCKSKTKNHRLMEWEFVFIILEVWSQIFSWRFSTSTFYLWNVLIKQFEIFSVVFINFLTASCRLCLLYSLSVLVYKNLEPSRSYDCDSANRETIGLKYIKQELQSLLQDYLFVAFSEIDLRKSINFFIN